MAIKRPSPKVFTEEQLTSIIQASQEQTGKFSRVRTYDPNFPLFETPVNQKVLVYVPNHVVTGPDASIDLRKDKFALHQTMEGRSFVNVRCTAGIVDEALHLDGSCSLCDGSADVWELYNKEYAEIAKSKNIATDSPEAKDALKQVRIDLLNKQVIRPAEVWYTFPIVVIACEEQNGKVTTIPKKNEKGEISGTPMWYSIREKTYIDKWGKAFETAPTDNDIPPTHPGGMWAVLNFEYESKDGKHDKMSSARALSVGFKNMTQLADWAAYFDSLTQDWTPAKAMETLVDNAIRSKEEQDEVADILLKPVRDRLAMYRLSEGAPAVAGGIPQGTATQADAVLASFGATSAPQVGIPAAPTGAVPQVPTADTNVGVN